MAQVSILSASVAFLPTLQPTLTTSWRISFGQLVKEWKTQVWFIAGPAWYVGTILKWMAIIMTISFRDGYERHSHKGQALGPYIYFLASGKRTASLSNVSTLINGQGLRSCCLVRTLKEQNWTLLKGKLWANYLCGPFRMVKQCKRFVCHVKTHHRAIQEK